MNAQSLIGPVWGNEVSTEVSRGEEDDPGAEDGVDDSDADDGDSAAVACDVDAGEPEFDTTVADPDGDVSDAEPGSPDEPKDVLLLHDAIASASAHTASRRLALPPRRFIAGGYTAGAGAPIRTPSGASHGDAPA